MNSSRRGMALGFKLESLYKVNVQSFLRQRFSADPFICVFLTAFKLFLCIYYYDWVSQFYDCKSRLSINNLDFHERSRSDALLSISYRDRAVCSGFSRSCNIFPNPLRISLFLCLCYLK